MNGNRNGMRAYFAIILSFIMAVCLSMLPMPSNLFWLRPDWLTLILIYWVAYMPNKVGVFSGFTLGLSIDFLRGNLIGCMGLSLSIVAYLTTVLRIRLRQANLSMQVIVILFLVSVQQILNLWLQKLFGGAIFKLTYLLPSLISVLIWPFLFIILQTYKRNLKIN